MIFYTVDINKCQFHIQARLLRSIYYVFQLLHSTNSWRVQSNMEWSYFLWLEINGAEANSCRRRILIIPFSSLSKIFLYSEGNKSFCGFSFFFFFLSVQSCFSFPNPPCCDCTQTDNKSQMNCELKAADERGKEELIRFLWLRTAYCFMRTIFK